ncbi:MAG: cob(I)yrinic acid a,c-diamide adenosyltransferase [Candidatus Lokiarchaeota archaeon]|nr:cob(I)yrinic acid a,c-diamide adenosyltransferase [Candidatus Lokiarchaeota archaeon]
MRLERGLIHYYYGKGKGKTSTLIGTLIRAHGHGLKTLLIQFLKLHSESEKKNLGYFMGEIHFLRKIIPVKQFGSGAFVMPNQPLSENDLKIAQKGFKFVQEAFTSQKYDVIAIDEIVDAIALNLVDLKEFINLLNYKPENLEVIFSGYNYIPQLAEIADYISNIDMKKHPYYSGIDARKGIEY